MTRLSDELTTEILSAIDSLGWVLVDCGAVHGVPAYRLHDAQYHWLADGRLLTAGNVTAMVQAKKDLQ